MIKLFDPHVTEEEINSVKDVLLSHNWASGSGSGKVKEFEDNFNKFLGSKEVVAVNSGTAALHFSLWIANIKDKDVLLPSLTFVSAAHSVIFNGGNPVFVDIEPNTLCIDPEDLERKIQKGKSAVVMPVHFGGMPCDMRRLMKISDEHHIKLIDDAAHACGSLYGNMKIGSFEEMTCFSFHPVKNLSMPTGGAISINNESHDEFKKKLDSMRWCGIDNRKGILYDVSSITPNYYMNEISAAIGLVQLNKLDKLNARRREIAKRYSNEIKYEHKMPYSSSCVYHLYWIMADHREELIKYLNSKGIEVGTHYIPIHTMSAYANFKEAKIPVTNEISKKIVTIPIHPNLSEENVSYVIETINSFE